MFRIQERMMFYKDPNPIVRVLENIDIVNIDLLNIAWQISLKDIICFVQLALTTEITVEERFKWAKIIYGNDSPSNLTRLISCFNVAKSIRDKGYLTPLSHDYTFDEDDDYIIIHGEKICLCGVLPRIISDKQQYLVDDGRHRLAVLSALGVKNTPVLMIKTYTSKEPWLETFKISVIKALEEFKNSDKWKKYIQTNDFKLLRRS